MMTETEVMAEALGVVFKDNPTTFGKEHAEKAINRATALFQAAKCDAATFGRVMARLGNHSQLRQWATMHGFINVEPDALHNALDTAIERLKKAEGDALKDLTEKK